MRLSKLIKNKYPHLSSTQIERAFEKGWIKKGDEVQKRDIQIESLSDFNFDPNLLIDKLAANKNLNCKLLKKTDDFIFLEKPKNMNSVALNFWETDTVANWLLSVDPQQESVSWPLESGLLHRLDYETSGLMVAACSNETHQIIRSVWEFEVIKEYECVTENPLAEGIYEAFAMATHVRGSKISVSDFESLKSHYLKTEVMSCKKEGETYKIRVCLHTGVRHQIRAHLAFLGAPLLGDSLYGGKKDETLHLKSVRIAIQTKGFEDAVEI